MSNFINKNFEPVWESVRAVPTVTIDFGNGKKITRTLHGNIATYVCTTNGDVIDVVPGIYTPDTYISRLASIYAVAKTLPSTRNDSLRELRQYHEDAIAHPQILSSHASTTRTMPMMRKLGGMSIDTQQNEHERRGMIHKYLSSRGGTTPDEMKRWLYREVLHADLDDPYLGVDKALSGTYPFDDLHS